MNKVDKHIFAAYFSDARLNIMLCLNDVREKTGLKPVPDEAQIVEMFKQLSLTNTTPERQDTLVTLLRKRFPFIDGMVDRGKKGAPTPLPKYYDDLFCWLFQLIHNLRNSMVHPAESETEVDHNLHRELFYALGKVYDSGLRTVQDRFKLNDYEIKPLQRYINKDKVKSISKFSLALCTDPRNRKNEPTQQQSKVLHDFGRVLLCSLFLEKSQSAELITHFWHSGYAYDWKYPQTGIIRELLSVNRIRLPFQRLQTDDTATTVTLDTLSELSRCPRILFDSLDPSDQRFFRVGTTLSSDEEYVDDELSRLLIRGYQNRFVPLIMRFFDLDDDCKLRFAIDLGQFYYNVRLKPGSQFPDGKSRVRRLSQKIIAYGKLSNFDDVGKNDIWKQLEKNYENSTIEEKEIRDQGTGDRIEQLKPYIRPTHPHYHYAEDKIGFRLMENIGIEAAAYPGLDLGTQEEVNNKISLPPIKGRDKRVLMEPHFWASPHQMLHVAFYHHLQKQQRKSISIDNIFRQYRSGMTRLINTLKDNPPTLDGEPHSPERKESCQKWIDGFFNEGKLFSISIADLPKVISRHLTGSISQGFDIVNRAKHLLEETFKKQKQIEHLLKYPKKRGKEGFKPIKCGNLGSFLADDLMRFQPKDETKSDGGKLNSQNFQILQKALAYYGAYLDEPPRINDLLQNAGLLSGKLAHPFLPKLINKKKPDQYKTLVDFYKAYLKAREKFLEHYIVETQKQPSITHPPIWLKLKAPSTLDNWLKEQLDSDGTLLQPLPIPKNILYKPLLNMISIELGISPDALCREGTQSFTRDGKKVEVRPAVSWLIKRYFAHIEDSAQKMYQYDRRHDLFDTYLDKRNMNSKQKLKKKKVYYLPEETRQNELYNIHQFINSGKDEEKGEKLKKLLRAYKRQERRIRHFSTQDMVLHLYAKQYFSKLLIDAESEPDWSLNALDNTLLKTRINYALPVPKIDKTIFHPECLIKNVGELRLLVRDRRLPRMVHYYPEIEKELNYAEVRAELDAYRRVRVRVFRLVHALELKTDRYFDLTDYQHVPEEQRDSFGTGRHSVLLYMLYQHFERESSINPGLNTQKAKFEPSCFDKARQIRNAFSHNEYPETGLFDEIVSKVSKEPVPENPANHRKVAEKLASVLEELYQPWFAYLDSLERKR